MYRDGLALIGKPRLFNGIVAEGPQSIRSTGPDKRALEKALFSVDFSRTATQARSSPGSSPGHLVLSEASERQSSTGLPLTGLNAKHRAQRSSIGLASRASDAPGVHGRYRCSRPSSPFAGRSSS